MASSRKPRSSGLPERVADVLVPVLPAGSSILLGLSGGVDSVVLLHLLQQLSPHYSWHLGALHVHHGISPKADSWAAFCADLCARYSVPLQVEHVDITPLRAAHGIEAAARKLRHAAFATQSCDFVALAHHADDQAETLLLQLLRGAGVRGVSAMPLLANMSFPHRRESSELFKLDSRLRGSDDAGFIHGLPENICTGSVVRPLLHCSRQEILDYAAANSLQWIEDESNADDNYPRNFLRHRVLPLLSEKFPAYRNTLARSAQHFAEASELLDDLARLDASDSFPSPSCGRGASARNSLSAKEDAKLSGARGEGDKFRLDVLRLQSLSQPRAKNLLRYFLHSLGAPMPQAVQLDDMLQQLCGAREDAAVCISYGGWQVHRYQGRVYALRALGEFDQSIVLPWHGEAELDWPALNTRLRFTRTQGFGISLAKLQRAPVTLRLRQGGEILRPHPNAATRTLKNLLQEHRVPPWQRDRLPLLYCGEEMVCVLGVAIAAEYQAVADEAGISVVFFALSRNVPGGENNSSPLP